MENTDVTHRLTVRPFQARDTQDVTSLWQAVFDGDPVWNDPAVIIRRKLAVQSELFLVGENDGRVVATVLAGYDGHRGWIYHLAVAADQRRQGFGRVMMAAAEERLRALGCPKINLQVRGGNAAVVRFYERLGYTIEDRVSMGRRIDQ